MSERIGFGFARRRGATIVGQEADHARVLCRDDVDPQVLLEIRRIAGRPLRLERCPVEQYEAMIGKIYADGAGSISEVGSEDMEEDLPLEDLAAALPEPEDLMESSDDAPIIRLINALLAEGVRRNASDIHVEPFEHRLVIRLRIDGVLSEVLSPPRHLAPLLVSRIKVMAKLDIAEKRLPQDGRISLRIAGRPVDVRVSTLPSGHGERVVMRLLDKQAGRLDLAQLGMSPHDLSLLEELIHRPHGILLVTGPTGSGKTTSLYAALQAINNRQRNIMTVEDPIEYFLDGIGQTQVNTRVEMTFARGLRAILRQDPDVVMVGEIRDLETAEIAIQASLTGHLVLSTLHTNSAVGAITRLRDMGVEPFLLASSLLGVIAQRLVRVLNPQQAEAYAATPADAALFNTELEPGQQLYRPRPDAEAPYLGRTGLYEMLVIDQPLRTLIHDGASEQSILEQARKRHTSLARDGWARACRGVTSLEEVLRVTRD